MAGYLGSVPVPQATQHRETFTATAGQTTFNTAGYTPLFVDVYLNGVHLSPADITATNGSDVVLAECVVNDIVDIVSYTPFEVASQTFTGNTIMTNGDNTAQLELISTDADSSAGPLLDFNRNSASPADGDVTGNIRFIGENDAGESTVFSDIINQTFDVSNGTEDGVMYIRTMEAGTLAYRITMNPTETVFNDDSLDQDFRVESNGNANMLFVDGGNDAVVIGHNDVVNVATISPSLQIEGTGFAGSAVGQYRYSADAFGPSILFASSRNASIAGQTILQNNDELGKLRFYGSDGNDFENYGAEIIAAVDGTPGSNDMPGRLVFSTTANNAGTTSERMRIDSSGNVLVGKTVTTLTTDGAVLSSGQLTVSAASGSTNLATANGGQITLANGNNTDGNFSHIGGYNSNSLVTSQINLINLSHANRTGAISFNTHNGSSMPEAMRITSGQDILVGKSTSAFGSAGIELQANASFICTRAGTTSNFNRISSDGAVSEFYKDGAVVGSIGVNGGDLYVVNAGGVGAGLKYNSGFPNVIPCNNTGENRDNVIDLGHASVRFDDIYATNGTIQTSDRNEKQDIAALTSTEMLVAKRISALFKTFRWKDKVAAKGDDARTHSGIIAQDVQAAFEAESLDAGDYSMFISTTWWEHDVDVAAVEADDIVVPPIEAADAYTRTDSYDTEDEAPSGSTKKTRLGIRYPELLSFLAAYNEQRFAAIETRLTALEG